MIRLSRRPLYERQPILAHRNRSAPHPAPVRSHSPVPNQRMSNPLLRHIHTSPAHTPIRGPAAASITSSHTGGAAIMCTSTRASRRTRLPAQVSTSRKKKIGHTFTFTSSPPHNTPPSTPPRAPRPSSRPPHTHPAPGRSYSTVPNQSTSKPLLRRTHPSSSAYAPQQPPHVPALPHWQHRHHVHPRFPFVAVSTLHSACAFTLTPPRPRPRPHHTLPLPDSRSLTAAASLSQHYHQTSRSRLSPFESTPHTITSTSRRPPALKNPQNAHTSLSHLRRHHHPPIQPPQLCDPPPTPGRHSAPPPCNTQHVLRSSHSPSPASITTPRTPSSCTRHRARGAGGDDVRPHLIG
ncbi:hypothetical protein C8J57DRAFT_1705165 [Mycena rebaudengoi]|nr:hypothetical protein C8J57DRAFT_1705165 [Mycena rebaudengoi]